MFSKTVVNQIYIDYTQRRLSDSENQKKKYLATPNWTGILTFSRKNMIQLIQLIHITSYYTYTIHYTLELISSLLHKDPSIMYLPTL